MVVVDAFLFCLRFCFVFALLMQFSDGHIVQDSDDISGAEEFVVEGVSQWDLFSSPVLHQQIVL